MQFAQTTGHKDFLRKENGDRRFWPIILDRTKVSGLLEGNAKAGMHPDGTAFVAVQLRQPGGLAIKVERCYGSSAESIATAVADAAHMVQGKRCQAVGYELGLDWAQEPIGLELRGCTDLSMVDLTGAHQ